MLAFFLTVSVGGADIRDISAVVNDAFRPLLTEYDVPGIAVAVTAGGKQYFFSYGVTAKGTTASVTKDTLFEIGSLSKTFTATLVSYEQTLGRISLDDHPSQYLPELRGAAIDAATLLNLGTYTAGGLPLQCPDEVADDSQMISYFQHWKPAGAPGSQRRYSNPSIGLFGHVTALAMRKPFADLIEAELFPALGLQHSYIRVPTAEMAKYAWGHDKANQRIRVNPGVFDAEAYGVKSSAADMVRFIEANLHPDTVKGPMRRAVEATHVGYFKVGDLVQGLGWEQYRYPTPLERLQAGNSAAISMEANPTTPLAPPQIATEPTLFDKTGSTNGFGAYVAFVPAKNIGIVMLANKNFPIPARITAAHAVLAAVAR